MYGELYKSLRGAVNGAMYGNQMEVLAETTQVCTGIALFSHVASL